MHYTRAQWNKARWPNFTARELACSHCGQLYYWPAFFDGLQNARAEYGRPIKINSGHRCRLHNARVGGAVFSQHLKIAVDINVIGQRRFHILAAMRRAGFTGFGFYQNFLHVDAGRPRAWSSEKGRLAWKL